MEVEKDYSYEQILVMLGGYNYFNEAQIRYVYHSLRNDKIEEEYYLNLCNEENKKLEKMCNDMKEIKENNKEISKEE